MKILSVISHKGGAGKTSTAVMLAEDLAQRGHRVLLVDADRQRGAGLLVGVDPTSTKTQHTQHPQLRYFCACDVPLREVPGRVEEFTGLFDVAVTDTPSLDDALARAWIQVSHAVLIVLPVEPVSLKTLDGLEASINSVRALNPRAAFLGILPTMFEADEPTQRALMLELVSLRPEGVIGTPIPYDPGLTHRAEQRPDRRTDASEETRAAYRSVADLVVRRLKIGREAAAAAEPGAEWSPRAPALPRAPLAAAAAAEQEGAGEDLLSGGADSTPAETFPGSESTAAAEPDRRWLMTVVTAVLLLLLTVGAYVFVTSMGRGG